MLLLKKKEDNVLKLPFSSFYLTYWTTFSGAALESWVLVWICEDLLDIEKESVEDSSSSKTVWDPLKSCRT